MKRFAFTIVLTFLVGCVSAPDESAIQTAIAQTQSAQKQILPTNTALPSHTPEPSQTPSVTATQTLEPTNTNTPEPTFTPTVTPDTRVIVGRPEDYILTPKDLPDKYVLLPGDSSPHNNSEILSARGIEEGKAYLAATRRVGGWIVWYHLVSSTAIAPEWVRSYVVMYEGEDGAELVMKPEWNNDIFDNLKDGVYELVELEETIGEETIFVVERERQPSGKYYVSYKLEFRYKNVWTQIIGEGMESDVPQAYIINLAKIVLGKLEIAPLAESWSQTNP